ncbi:MAG: hypothetical protein LBI05_03980 [Planctomycetaceae bacterium]|jgi:hypothetical protein|nr:hypothetical protein [Planctomycetaceae bacterium]
MTQTPDAEIRMFNVTFQNKKIESWEPTPPNWWRRADDYDDEYFKRNRLYVKLRLTSLGEIHKKVFIATCTGRCENRSIIADISRDLKKGICRIDRTLNEREVYAVLQDLIRMQLVFKELKEIKRNGEIYHYHAIWRVCDSENWWK